MKHIVIIGAGFGGLNAARELAGAPVNVTLIDRTNHHLFQPLLYQVATAGLSPADISYPIRSVLSSQKNAEVFLGEVKSIDTANKRVFLEDRSLTYDALIVATGAQHSYFGKDEWAQFAPGLKTIEDAVKIRSKILLAFEKAEIEPNPKIQSSLLTFAIVGGGPTGVELAGAIAELAHRALDRDFRHINPHSTQIVLIEAGPRILAGFPEKLSTKATDALTRLGVDVRVNTKVESINGSVVSFGGGHTLEAQNILWAAGVMASPVAQWLSAPADRSGRVHVNPDLSVPGLRGIYVIGDAAHFPTDDGRGLPGVAQVAIQMGQFLGANLRSQLAGKPVRTRFVYRDKGNMATIGRSSAIADIGRFEFAGFFAWLLWCFIHVAYLIGFRSRAIVMIQWAWAYLTFQRGARLITRF